MQIEEFWRLIASSKASSDGSFDGYAESLQETLSQLPEANIVAFDRTFDQFMNRADTWDLWGAAYIIGGGCGDDSFIDFRSWLISMGQAVYESAVADAESLADIELGPEAEEDVFFEEFAYVASRAYEEKTGTDMPRTPALAHAGTSGEEWDEDGDDLAQRFPQLWAKYGDN
jgi:hypothetical protein